MKIALKATTHTYIVEETFEGLDYEIAAIAHRKSGRTTYQLIPMEIYPRRWWRRLSIPAELEIKLRKEVKIFHLKCK